MYYVHNTADTGSTSVTKYSWIQSVFNYKKTATLHKFVSQTHTLMLAKLYDTIFQNFAGNNNNYIHYNRSYNKWQTNVMADKCER